MKIRSLFLILLLALFAPWAAKAQSVTIGSGTATSQYVPSNSYYNYAISQQIYTADEIDASGTITSISFYNTQGTGANNARKFKIYMAHTDKSSFESTSDWIALTSDNLVYEATSDVTLTPNTWTSFTLSTPFAYNGTSNLVVCVIDNSGDYSSGTHNVYRVFSTGSEYQALYAYNDNYTSLNPNGTNGSTSISGYRLQSKNQIILGGIQPTCAKPTELTCTAYTATTATLEWTENGTATEWVLEYGTADDFTGATSVNVSGTPSKELTGFTAEQTYYARVRPDCDENKWSNVCEFKPTAAQTVTIGSGTGTTSYFPSNPNYDYSYTQQIYTAAEIGQIGAIKSVSFKGNRAGTRTFVVYMANTTKETFADKTDVIPIADATQVFSGSVTFTANEWKTIELAGDGFDYDGGNLAIIVDDNSGNWTMGSTNWAAFSTSGNQALCFYRDSNDIDPSSPVSSSNSVSTSKNQIILCILPSNTPKPRNIQVSDITASQATVSWEAPATGTPTGYEYQIKVSGDEWPTPWINAENNLSVEPTGLTASTDYVVRVRATYAEGESDPIETEFRTLDACAFPTNFTATTTPGVGTDANFSWVKGYDETAWNLQLATDVDFNNVVTTYFTDDGFVVDGNNVTFHATDLTPEQTYYARVQADCGGGSTSVWSNVETFTPSNYVDYTYGANASTTNSYIPFYGSYANDSRTISQYIIPATELADVAGGTVRSLTYYTNSTPNWGTATVKVYVKEVDYTTFAASSAEAVEDWETMTQVYNGSLTVSNGQMTITFDDTYLYGGGNLMIGIKMDQTGTSASVNWTSAQGSSSNYNGLYAYYSTSYYSYGMSYYRSYNYPKTTINYQPTPYKYPVIDEASCTFETTTAHIAWTVTGATPTGYQYQYKPASATEWPTAWTSATTTYADLSDLTPGSFYDFRVKALYEGNHESVVVDYDFWTQCTAVTAFPWKEDFETYSNGNFSHPCWVNEHGTVVGSYASIVFKVATESNGNSTHQLQLPDQQIGNTVKLRLPEMNLPSNDYQFVIDVYRSNSTPYNNYPYEGIRVFASTDGNIEGATELTFIPRQYNVSSTLIPEESEVGWYTYEIPIGVSGTCYIILRGESQYCTSTFMDNLTVEQIPTCARPSELASSNATNHSATIEWTAGDTEQTLWQIAYSKTNFDPNTANFDVTTVTTIDATAHPFTLDKILDAESTYYVYVRANCGTAAEPDFGPWSRKGINFTTLAATPAPSNFVATNPASTKVDLVWNAGGGDFESWELYYVASETAPEAPTASTQASVSDITTLPTTENPYVLDGLTATTKYYAWVRAKHVWNNETTYSDWVALTGNYFETLDACPTPTNLVATNLTSVSADLSWVGSDDVTEGYTVEYGEEGTYSLNETVDFSGLTTAGYSSEGVLPEGWMRYNSNPGYMPHVSDASACGDINEFGTGNNYLLMTQNKSSNQYLYAIMPQISDLASLEFKYVYESTGTGVLSVGYVTDNTGYSTYQVLQTPTKSGTIATCKLTATDIATINANNGYVTFRYEGTSGTYYSVGIDDIVYKGGTYTPDATQTVPSEGTSITISNLTPNKTYIVKVKSNCTSGEYCEPITFTTLAAGNMVFTNATNDGKWGTAGNWAPAQMPVLTDEVILRANATIESGCVAEANKINLNSNTLTIADGGQLITNTAVAATVQKVINAHGATVQEGGWNFIALPIHSSSLNPTSAGLITDAYGATIPEGQSATYDLYKFNQNPSIVDEIGNEWMNYRKASFNLANGNGYLYANAAIVTLNFTGNIRAYTQEGAVFGLIYSDGNPDANMHGWNLMGNPYTFNAYVNMSYYKMNETGSAIEPVDAYQTTTIAPCTGIMVQATETGQSITFSKVAPSAQNGKGNLSVALAQANVRNNTIMDKAVLSFNEGSQLGKFYFGENAANIYFPQDNKEFAIVSSEGQGEMPLSFRANENGTYTLSFNAEEVTFNYLHLIDNMTGADVDLLAATSTGSVATYTFNARTTDYSSRFKLVFATGSNNDSDNFAFYSNGTWVIGNEGEATLQVIDVTGRVLSSETVNGSVSKAINAAPGVYMIRLINGNDVKTQKIVVR